MNNKIIKYFKFSDLFMITIKQHLLDFEICILQSIKVSA